MVYDPVTLVNIPIITAFNQGIGRVINRIDRGIDKAKDEYISGKNKDSELDLSVFVDGEKKNFELSTRIDQEVKTNLATFKATRANHILFYPILGDEEIITTNKNKDILDTMSSVLSRLNYRTIFSNLTNLKSFPNRKIVAKQMRSIGNNYLWAGTIIRFTNPMPLPYYQEHEGKIRRLDHKYLPVKGLKIIPNELVWKDKLSLVYHYLEFSSLGFGNKQTQEDKEFLVGLGRSLIPNILSDLERQDLLSYANDRDLFNLLFSRFSKLFRNHETTDNLRKSMEVIAPSGITQEGDNSMTIGTVLDNLEIAKINTELEEQDGIFGGAKWLPITSVSVKKHSNFKLYIFTYKNISIELWFSKNKAFIQNNYSEHLNKVSGKDKTLEQLIQNNLIESAKL